MVLGVVFLQAVVFAILSGIVASNKNRDPAGWGIIGFLFGLFGFIAAIAVGDVEEDTRSSRRQTARRKSPSSSQPASEKRQKSTSQGFDPDEHEKKCPDCAEYIKLEARVCKHCGHAFSDEEVERQIEEKKNEVESEQQEEEDESEETVDIENMENVPKYTLNTHNFVEGKNECSKCGLSKSYIVEHKYKCPYSDR